MKITKLYLTKSSASVFVVEIDGDGKNLKILPANMVRAEVNVSHMTPYKGSPHGIEPAAPHLVMTMTFCGYPVDEAYHEASVAENAKLARE
jgi:hypothetical protein